MTRLEAFAVRCPGEPFVAGRRRDDRDLRPVGRAAARIIDAAVLDLLR